MRFPLSFGHRPFRPVQDRVTRLAVAALSALVLAAPARGADPASAASWRRVAERDLAQVRSLIEDAHPAILEPENKPFQRWRRVGYARSMALARQSRTRQQAEAAVQYFLVGFEDGHLGIRADAPPEGPARWAGFNVQWRDGRFRVVDRAGDWPRPLPPSGAEVLACDGVDLLSLLARRVSPYVDRRMHLDGTKSLLAMRLTNEWSGSQLWESLHLASCTVRREDGAVARFALHWRSGHDGLRLWTDRRPPPGLRPWGTDALWVHASDFQLAGAGADAFEADLDTLARQRGARWIVLDARGNRGGNAVFGLRLLEAVLGGPLPADGPSARAHWRVSRTAIDTLQLWIERMAGDAPSVTATRRFVAQLRAAMLQAQADHQPWVAQATVDLAWGSHVAEGAPPFAGRILLITDSVCASACLDFADAVLAIPGARHAGTATSGDTVYLEVAERPLASGLKVWVPMKVWRGRARKNNEPHRPEFAFPGDIRDTAEVERWLRDEVMPRIEAGAAR